VSVQVEVITEATDELVAAFGRLIPQMSRSAPPLDREALGAVARHEAITLLVALLDGEVVGTLTLVMFPIPTGLRAWIEDVVVDEKARRHGTGKVLSETAVRLAREAGARTIDLTSRPSRQAAGRLYERIGFVQRDSRVYRYAVETGAQDS
jgi:ribosomal protein S18 acetylase RimI-like enzyme